MVTPRGNVAGALFVILEIIQLSEVNGNPRFTELASQLLSALTITFGGGITVGFELSFTVTV
jgi:hypothetical protein